MSDPLMPLDHCPVCRSSDRRKLFDIPESAVFLCQKCSLRFLDPCLSPIAMADAYTSQETLTKFHEFHASYYDYGNLNISSKTREDFARGLRSIEKVQPKSASKRIFDVGYGNGFFLALAKQGGWTVDGIDTSEENRKLSQKKFGLSLKVGDFGKDVSDGAVFDAVTFWDVIEHLPDPYPMIQKAARILKPGGIILVAVPNDQSFLRFLSEFLYRISHGRFKSGLEKIYLLEHVAYYSLSPLQGLFRSNGFEPIEHFYTSTDLAKYSFSLAQRLIAGLILTLGRITCRQNRVVALFRKTA